MWLWSSYSDDFIKQQIKISNLKYQEIDNPHEIAANFLSEAKLLLGIMEGLNLDQNSGIGLY